jgi:uncharacterized protein (TIGR04255 family)
MMKSWKANGKQAPGGVAAVFDLPAPGAYRLERPPLATAIAQVSFPLIGRLQELAGVTSVQEALRPMFPYMERVQVSQVQVGFRREGLESLQATTGLAWKFTDDDGWTATVEPGAATLSVGPTYGSIEEMAIRWKLLLDALAGVPGMVRCDRIGVRYVNIAEVAPGSKTWPQWFRSELLGWPALDIFGDHSQLTSTVTQTIMTALPTGQLTEVPHNLQALVHNGVLPAGSVVPLPALPGPPPLKAPSLLLDIDLFVVGPQPFASEPLLSQFRLLHGQIDSFFYWSLTDEGKSYFGINRD